MIKRKMQNTDEPSKTDIIICITDKKNKQKNEGENGIPKLNL